MTRLLPYLLLPLLCACTETQTVRVRICGGVEVPREVDGLRVGIRDQAGEERTVGVFELLRCPEEIVRDLPVEVTLPTSKEVRWISVEGLRLGLVVLEAEVRLEGARGEAEIWLDSSCLGLECPRGQSCLAASCTISPPSDAIAGACEAGGPSLDAGPAGDQAAGTPGDASDSGEPADTPAATEDPGAGEPDAGTSDAESSDPGTDHGLCGPQGGSL